jgi:hypothetical protein
MKVKRYIADLVTGVLDVWGDEQSLPASTLALLDELLGLWAETCGLDFSGDPEEDYPLSICWCKKQDAALPIVRLLIKRNYEPFEKLVFFLVWSCWRVVFG